jgi:hypothetical protein
MGSTRAGLRHGEVNLERKTAVIVKYGHQQLGPMAQRIYIKPLVGRVLAAMRCGRGHELVEKHEDGTFSLKLPPPYHRAEWLRAPSAAA